MLPLSGLDGTRTRLVIVDEMTGTFSNRLNHPDYLHL